ncbi:jg25870 [Pararge aegeria aegeria]|uniref:Jg25870 protein n=2 Tax=Pararge aegeria TaxID=116150 RepID=A0A8S4RRQ2_9NEOP|nr:jg25870 [Pararge aegeria aegeria]
MFKLVVLFVVLAVAAGSPQALWGGGFATPWATPVAAGFAAPFGSPVFSPYIAPAGPVAPIGAHNYRGPLSLAPGQPANILAADGRPLDTLSVNLDRAVHYTARALEGNGRRLQKRSIVAANLAGGQFGAGSLGAGSLAAGPLAATSIVAAPLTLGRSWVGPAPLAPVALAVGGRFGNIW